MWTVTRLLWGSSSLGSQASRSFSLGSRNLARSFMPQPKNTDRWNQKRAQFGVYDNIGILGRELSVMPSWAGKSCTSDSSPPGTFYYDREAYSYMNHRQHELGDFKAHPKHLIVGPSWLRGWRGNELQRCIRKKMMIGSRMFYEERHNLNKRISYLYKRFNRYGKHR